MFCGKLLGEERINWIKLGSKKLFKFKTVCVLLCGLICFTIYTVCLSISDDNSSIEGVYQFEQTNQTNSDPHVLCVLVPYRDRFEELLEFVPHMSKFMNRQSIKFHIVIINHLPDGGYRFNKGSAFNAGFLIISKKFPECDYIALHDIDTLPLTSEVSYAYPGNVAYHGIPIGYHSVAIYSFPAFVGGILLMPNGIFVKMNGFGNSFWGWGFEDHDFYRRIKKYSIELRRPEKFSTHKNNSFKHTHGETKVRDRVWCQDQATAWNTRHRTDNTGLRNVDFILSSENELTIDGYPFSVFNIIIRCNFDITPWCKPNCVDKPVANVFDVSDANNNPFKDTLMWRFMNHISQVPLKRK